MIELARAGAARYAPTRSTRRSPSCAGCCAATSSSSATASTTSPTARLRVVAGLRPRAARRRGASSTLRRAAACRSTTCPSPCAAARWSGDLLLVAKTNALFARAPPRADGLHRRPPRRRADGEIVGESRLIGLFTPKAYAEPASDTPLLGHKLRQILDGRGADRGLARPQGGRRDLRLFPKDELFAAPARTCAARCVAAGAGGHRRGPRARPPRRRRADRVADRRAAARPLQRGAGRAHPRPVPAPLRHDQGRVAPGHRRRRPRARALHVHAPGRPARAGAARARGRGRRLARTWDDALRDAARRRHGAARGRRAGRALVPAPPRLLQGLPSREIGRRTTSPASSGSAEGEDLVVGLQHAAPRRDAAGALQAGGKVELSETLPILEVLGLRVIEESPTRLVGGDDEIWVQNFGVLGPDGAAARPRGAAATRLADTIAAVWRGETESDSLNRLVVVAGLDRAAGRDPARLPQVPPAGRRALHRELPERRVRGQPARSTAKLVRYFELRFDPRASATRRPRPRCARRSSPTSTPSPRSTTTASCATSSALIDATLRTNAFKPGPRGDRVQAALGRRPGDPAAARRCSRSSSTPPRWRASTCAAARSPAAACAGRTAWTTAPRSTA